MKTLRTITIDGFKSVEHAELELGDLNVVIGANGRKQAVDVAGGVQHWRPVGEKRPGRPPMTRLLMLGEGQSEKFLSNRRWHRTWLTMAFVFNPLFCGRNAWALAVAIVAVCPTGTRSNAACCR